MAATERQRDSDRAARRRLCVTLAAAGAALVVALHVGSIALSPLDVAAALFGSGDADVRTVVLELRGPRVLLAALVGACLAVAGMLAQAITRNPLADPGLLGASAGSGFCVLLLMGLWPAAAAWPAAVPLASVGGALLAGGLVVALAARRTGLGPLELVLTGLAVNMLLSAAMSMVALVLPAFVHRAMNAWLVGSFSSADPTAAIGASVVLGVCLPLVWTRSRLLDVHGLGDEVAIGLGVDVGRLRLEMAGWIIVLCGSAYAVAGGIPFVGLLAPHVARRVLGAHAHWLLLPAAAAIGAALVATADAIGRVVTFPVETPAGVLVALLGGPWFLLLLAATALRRQPGGRSASVHAG